MTTLKIPTPLRPYTDGMKEIEIESTNVNAVIREIITRYPALKPHLLDESENLRSYVSVFLNDEDVRTLQGMDTPVKQEDHLMIVPSIAGGLSSESAIAKVDHAALRTNQAMIIGLLLIAFVADLPTLALIVGVIMAIGTVLAKPGFILSYRLLRQWKVIKPEVLPDNPEPHSFAQGFGSIVLFGAAIAFGLNGPIVAWILTWVVIVLAGVNLFLGFCVGCAVYYWLNRIGLPLFRQESPAGRFPGIRPPKV